MFFARFGSAVGEPEQHKAFLVRTRHEWCDTLADILQCAT